MLISRALFLYRVLPRVSCSFITYKQFHHSAVQYKKRSGRKSKFPKNGTSSHSKKRKEITEITSEPQLELLQGKKFKQYGFNSATELVKQASKIFHSFFGENGTWLTSPVSDKVNLVRFCSFVNGYGFFNFAELTFDPSFTQAKERIFVKFFKDVKSYKLLNQLHSGFLEPFDKVQFSASRDYQKEVLSYCASQLHTLPNIVYRLVDNLYTIEIYLPEYRVRTIVKLDTNFNDAEKYAFYLFLRHVQLSTKASIDSKSILRDFRNLNMSNARGFVEFYATSLKKESKTVSSCLHSSLHSASVVIDGFTFPSVHASNQDAANSIAYLYASQALKNKHPDLWESYAYDLRKGNGVVLQKIPPGKHRTFKQLTEQVSSLAETLLSKDRDAERYHAHFLSKVSSTINEDESSVASPILSSISLEEQKKLNAQRKEALEAYDQNDDIKSLRDVRKSLPIYGFEQTLLRAIEVNPAVIVVADTGSGKTTQLPQMILDDYIRRGEATKCNIMCTQPRRLSAVSVAERVANERNESLRKSVGYFVRFENRTPTAPGSILFCTTGIALRKLQDSNSVLSSYSHIILDEVHERSLQTDLLLAILKTSIVQLMHAGLPYPKLILMSATIDAKPFQEHLSNLFIDGNCPLIKVPGRAFPVEKNYLEDILPMLQSQTDEYKEVMEDKSTRNFINHESSYMNNVIKPSNYQRGASVSNEDAESNLNIHSRVHDGEVTFDFTDEAKDIPFRLLASLLGYLCANGTLEGSILVFLPGLAEMTKLQSILVQTKPFGIDVEDSEKYKIYMLHSSLKRMNEVFCVGEKNVRRIILATNIAETGITIPDVAYVVDSCLHREKMYCPHRRVSALLCHSISKANMRQRCGRAGRVQPGEYYALISEAHADALPESTVPEIHRSDLQDVCLQVLSSTNFPLQQLLKETLEPPSTAAVNEALALLKRTGALTNSVELTPLGKLLAHLPMEPSMGKMIICAAVFKCLDPLLYLTAAMTTGDVFFTPIRDRETAQARRRQFDRVYLSDHLTTINAIAKYRSILITEGRNKAFDFAHDNFLNVTKLNSALHIAEQIHQILVKLKLVPYSSNDRSSTFIGHPSANEHADSQELILALLNIGLLPNLAITRYGRFLRTPTEQTAMVHRSSIAFVKSSHGVYAKPDEPITQGKTYLYTTKSSNSDQGVVFLHSISPTSPLMLLLFETFPIHSFGPCITFDNWYTVYFNEEILLKCLMISSFIKKFFIRLFEKVNLTLSTGASPRRMLISDNHCSNIAAGLKNVAQSEYSRYRLWK
ncbi:ATP-dependent RNA helicase A-like protein [Schizosaccharomyces japonicus yFS275]|uniref:RNA helicase n=1 Tax=Schizosaccharomyces japonicus (strain yFS275 / FY16936) TaxID=402676 RepID=B6JZC4_SCHJY|nr:ATP-dependent RNA helicase A-like protein [Schizosaccharomyces japonicus yFS275]EEB06892.1 ATP-dependent RNA helicase A-like protein [Schizosaccharomyces japonicus yFS275]